MTDEQINAAIAEACGWTKMSDDQLWRMAREIKQNDKQWCFPVAARQRAEAFLRTLGKWEEVKK